MRCRHCGNECERTGRNQKLCPDCRREIGKDLKRTCRQKNRERYNKTSKERRRSIRAAKRRPFFCSNCGIGTTKNGPRQKYCGNCAERLKKARSKYYYQTEIRIGERMVCELCGQECIRRSAIQRTCPDCRPKLAVFAERRRNLRKRGIGGSHTVSDFRALCEKYNWRCAYCGKNLTAKTVTKDHVIPISRGGTDVIGNIVPACLSCNAAKQARTGEEFLGTRVAGT